MSTSEADESGAPVRLFFANRSIRWKLAIGFGALLILGAVNIALYYWGAHRRSVAWQEVQQAIQRQIIVTDVHHLLDDQKKYVDVLTSVIGAQDGEAASEQDQERFEQGIDSITADLSLLVDLVEPDRRESATRLYEKTLRLGASWKRFYRHQWADSSEAIAELYINAEPIAEELLANDLPAAVEYERSALARLSAEFVHTDRTFSRVAWISFLLSALVGGGIAVVVSGDFLRKISALKKGTEKLGAGDLKHRIEILGRDELGNVATSVNDMARRLNERSDELAAQRDQIEEQRDDLRRTLERLRATQAKLVQQEKLASLGALTAGIAHEIKNPLNFINNFASLCEELAAELEIELKRADDGLRADDDEVATILRDLQTNARKISEHGRRADTIVRSMLLHSRGQPGERRQTNVNTLLEEYVNLAYHGMRAQKTDFVVTIERRLDERVREISAVPQELGRVLINLLNNAFYAVYEKAGVENDDYIPCVTVETKRRDGCVEIRISDNGTGIPEDVRKHIFEPFYTTKPTGEGTGLGLSLSREIVTQLHGGTIEVESETGRGTGFTIVLPDQQGGEQE